MLKGKYHSNPTKSEYLACSGQSIGKKKWARIKDDAIIHIKLKFEFLCQRGNCTQAHDSVRIDGCLNRSEPLPQNCISIES